MGLDVSHDAWSGPYTAFNRWRGVICQATGGSWPPHDDMDLLHNPELEDGKFYVGEKVTTEEEWSGLWYLLRHSDCEGDIAPDMAALIARDLERLLPDIEITAQAKRWQVPDRPGYYVEKTRLFIRGCLRAHAAGQYLIFR